MVKIKVQANGKQYYISSPTALGKLFEQYPNYEIKTGNDFAWVQQVQLNLKNGYSYLKAAE